MTRTSYQPDIFPSPPTSGSPFSASLSVLVISQVLPPFLCLAPVNTRPACLHGMGTVGQAPEPAATWKGHVTCGPVQTGRLTAVGLRPSVGKTRRSSELCHRTPGSSWSRTGCSRRKRHSLDSGLRADKNQVPGLTPPLLSAQRFLSRQKLQSRKNITPLLSFSLSLSETIFSESVQTHNTQNASQHRSQGCATQHTCPTCVLFTFLPFI